MEKIISFRGNQVSTVSINPVIEKSTSGILSGGNRYTYVMNNPLKYTDPSGYAFTRAEILLIIRYLFSLDYGGSFSSGGGGSGPSVTPYNSANDAFQAGFEQKFGFEPGCTLEEYTNAFVRNGYDRKLGQFKGFDGHFFERDSKTGDFYVPGTDEKINPVDVFTGEIDWYNMSMLDKQLYELSKDENYSNSTDPSYIDDPPFPNGGTIENWVIPVLPAIKAVKVISTATRVVKFPGKYPDKAPKGFEWRGKPGSKPGSKDGNWFNPRTGESLRPDLNHPDPVGPHWDYRDLSGKWWRLFPDGSKIPKL